MRKSLAVLRACSLAAVVMALSGATAAAAQVSERGNGNEAPVPVAYDLKVTIEPAVGSIAVRGRIDVPRQLVRSQELKFGLHETFAIKRLRANGRAASFSSEPATLTMFNPATKNVAVKLPAGLPQGGLRLNIEYEGRLKDIPEFGTYPDQKQALDDQINTRLVELASYSSWYPQFAGFGYPLQVDLEVSLPQGWTAICSGKKLDQRVTDGRAITRWSSAKDSDLVIAAAPNYKQKKARLTGLELAIFHTQLADEFVSGELRQVADVMQLFSNYLGETAIPAGTLKHVYSPKRHGQGRAGIARPGMIVTSEGRTLERLAQDSKFSLFQDIAHEIAHFWWNCGAGQGDWINEAFAEYFSALAVEKVVSKEQLDAVLDRYRKGVRTLPAAAPSLATVPFDGSMFFVRYYKGALMLDALRHALGDEKFFRVSRDFFQTYKGQSIGTVQFRSFWKERLGDRKELVDRWLDSGGGLPETAASSKGRFSLLPVASNLNRLNPGS